MTSTPTALTREELFERVWSKPVREVAADLGISDVGLAKACRRSGIPLPPQGYWIRGRGRKRAHSKPRLPAPRAGQQTHFEFGPRAPKVEEVGRPEREELQQRLVALASDLEASSASVARFVKAARRTVSKRLDDRGIMAGTGPLPWPLRTSSALTDRAADVLAGLLARMHVLGHTIQFAKDRPDMAMFTIHGQEYWVWLEEHSRRSDYVPTAKDLAEKKRAEKERTYYFAPNKWVFTPSGKLYLKLAHVGWSYVRHQWGDRGSKKLEDRLDEIVIDIVEFATDEKRQAELDAQRQAEEEALQLRERERLQRVAHERLKRTALLREVRVWQRATRLHQYIDAVEAAPLATLSHFETEVARQRWITWAKGIAAQLNPLESGSVGEIPPLPALPDLSWGYRSR